MSTKAPLRPAVVGVAFGLGVLALACGRATAGAGGDDVSASRQPLSDAWLLKSSVLVKEEGQRISQPGYKPEGWLKTSVPSTVLSALVKNGIYPDPRIGLDCYRIPDSSDEFNEKYDLAKYSYLPGERNPWRDPYWYRTDFDLSPVRSGGRVWLNFNSINYRAEVWLNGQRIADREGMAGMFQRFRFDVTPHVRPGRNALAVEIFPVDHPGLPDKQVTVFGKHRGEHKEIERDVTMIETVGYDCMMTVPDRNMGICQDVFLDGTRFWIPSGYFPDFLKGEATATAARFAHFREDLPTGMNDLGNKSYKWQEPVTYFRWVREDRSWMFKMESGSASLPPVSSLARFLPDLGAPSSAGAPFPLTDAWAHHGANDYYQPYDQAIRRLHGEPESVADYCWKGHLVTADQHRSFYEAVNHRMWDITSGFTEWKINSCFPDVQWQNFDYYHKPVVSHFYIKRACQPLHVQLNLIDHAVSVVNCRLQPQQGLAVSARVFDLEAKPLWHRTARLDVPANTYREAFTIARLAELAPLCFVKLELKDAAGKLVSDNFYWLRGQGVEDYNGLPGAESRAKCI